MVATYLVGVSAVVLLTVVTFNLIMPSITRRDLLFGVTVAPNARASAEARDIIGRYRIGVVAIAVLTGVGLWLLYAFAPAAWWTSGALAPLALLTALLPGAPYIPAHLAARRLAVQPERAAPAEAAPAAALHPRRYSDYVPWIWEALPLGIIAATAAYLGTTYAAAPAIIPTHFGADGQPNAFAAKTIGSYFGLVWTQISLEIVLTLVALVTVRAKAQPDRADEIFRRRGLRYIYAVKVLVLALMGGLAIWIAHAQAVGHANASWVLTASLVFVVIITLLGIIIALRTGQGGARLAGASPVDRTDDRYWFAGVIYHNRDDPSVIVERRYGFGWTFNVANWRSWALLIAILAIPLLASVISIGTR
jgi:uncharacterized membrane protein